MQQRDRNEVREVIREGIAPVIFEIAKWDADPLRDCRLISRAALDALSSAGFVVVRPPT